MSMLLLSASLQILVAVALVAVVAMHRRDAVVRLRRLEAARREQSAGERRLRLQILELEGELADLRDRPTPPPEPAAPAVANAGAFAPEPVLTLSKRSHALKLLRKGDAPEAVAKAVGVPRNQIRLLVRVREMIEGREAGG